MNVARASLALLTIVTSLCATGWSQSITGSLRGIVTDSSGQPVPGATIIISSESLIGRTRTASSNQSGVFRFASLPVGAYSVESKLNGFLNARVNQVEVSMGTTVNVPLIMEMATSETITVAGETPMIDPQNSGTPTIYKEQMVENLTTRRNMWVLLQVAPGVTVDNGDSLEPALIAFGSNRQSNSWNIDGIDVTGSESGNAWWYTNPDIIDEIQIYGAGAPAEYGNHLGAVINVVTRKGGNSIHGGFNSFLQTQALTDVNVRLPDSDFVYHRNQYHDLSAQVGGPILKDRVWYFGAVETLRDSYATPGVDPIYVSLTKSDKYDFKVTAALSSRHELNSFFHYEKYDFPEIQSPYNTRSATGHTFGTNPSVGATLTSVFSEKFLMELGYAGWRGREDYGSITNSFEEPYWNYFEDTYAGGLFYPYDYTTFRHQLNGKATYYADDFLKSQHEFKFGVQYSYGSGDTIYSWGANGGYTVNYGGPLLHYYQAPFHYGGTSSNLGLFVDDSIALNERLTLNVGLRFDRTIGSFPEFDRLEVGAPSISHVMNVRKTGEKLSGLNDYVDWNLLSPRLGFVWLTRDDGRAAFRGSFGVYYDHNTMGNWDFPPPDTARAIGTDGFWLQVPHDQKLKPPRALQYSLGYEFQPTQDSSIGVQYVHKDTDDLVGWQITGGTWLPFEYTDPFTGEQHTFHHLDLDGPPAVRQKGNDPGDFPGSKGLNYFQTYDAAIVTFSKPFADFWQLNASYTWSRSYGLIPRMISQQQFQTFYGNHKDGVHPNQYINATGLLQADRPSMFRAQVVFKKLPWDFQAASSIEFSSGRPYNRQAILHLNLVGCPECQGNYNVNIEPPGSRRHAPIQNIDLMIGKRLPFDHFQLMLNGAILNLLNSGQELNFVTLALNDPSDTFVPNAWVQPRRLQLQVAAQF